MVTAGWRPVQFPPALAGGILYVNTFQLQPKDWRVVSAKA